MILFNHPQWYTWSIGTSQNSISSNGTNSPSSLSNPFVSLDVVNKTITQKLSNVFDSSAKANYSDDPI
jgi:hypothetical protein